MFEVGCKTKEARGRGTLTSTKFDNLTPYVKRDYGAPLSHLSDDRRLIQSLRRYSLYG